MNFVRLLLVLFAFSFLSCQPNKEIPVKPNILLIMADDLGYADMGSFGGDIHTPNLDALAQNGIRFSRFHTAPFCAVTRAMVLSGNNNHIAGMGVQGLVTGIPGYEGQLSDRVITIPEILREAGYHTYMAGKWHLGLSDEANPVNHGFDQSYVLLEGAGNHYNDTGFSNRNPISPYTENGLPVAWKEGDYSTDFYTDRLISYIDKNKEDDQPFFAFAAYTSPHWPLQVDEKYWKKYEGRYDAGYEQLKKDRFESLKNAGMIAEDAVLPPNHPDIKPWDSLSIEAQKIEARKMELYAGMVDNLDENIGRLLTYLKEIGAYENTLIVFMSDNGAAAEDFYNRGTFQSFLQPIYSDDYQDMGKANSFVSYGPQWAEAGSSPFKYYKGFTTEGGVTAPMIIAGYGVSQSGSIDANFLTLMDLAPTFYEMAGTQYATKKASKKPAPLMGKSITALLKGSKDPLHDSSYVFGLEHRGDAMLRKGHWKIVNTQKPFALENFELYNLETDLAEQQDVREMHPQVYQEMLSAWEKFAAEVKVSIPTPARGEGLEMEISEEEATAND